MECEFTGERGFGEIVEHDQRPGPSFRGASAASEPGIQSQALNFFLDSGPAAFAASRNHRAGTPAAVHIAGDLSPAYLQGQEHNIMNLRTQPDLFAATPDAPQGFRYESEAISAKDERGLIEQFRTLPFKEFEFQGFLGRRRVVSFGWRYDFNGGAFQKTDAIPDFLKPLRQTAAQFAGIEAEALALALVLEYPPGAAIGWHKDRAVFDDVIGVSLQSPCTFRFRRKLGS